MIQVLYIIISLSFSMIIGSFCRKTSTTEIEESGGQHYLNIIRYYDNTDSKYEKGFRIVDIITNYLFNNDIPTSESHIRQILTRIAKLEGIEFHKILYQYWENRESIRIICNNNKSVYGEVAATLGNIHSFYTNTHKKYKSIYMADKSKGWGPYSDSFLNLALPPLASTSIIFIEGESEEKVIPAWVLKKSGIPLVPPFTRVEKMGTVGSKARNQVKHWDSLLKEIRIPAIFLFDEVEQKLLDDIHNIYDVPVENIRMLEGDIEDYYPIDSVFDFLVEKFEVDTRKRSELVSELKKTETMIKTIDSLIHEHGSHQPGSGAWKVELAEYIAMKSETSQKMEPTIDWIIDFVERINNLNPDKYSVDD